MWKPVITKGKNHVVPCPSNLKKMLQKIKGDTFLSPLIFLPLKLSFLLTYLIIFCPFKQHLGIYMYITFIFQDRTCRACFVSLNKKIFVCWERTYQTQAQTKNVSYTFPYIESKFCILKYFLIIIISLFSYSIILFSILNKFLFFFLWEIFVVTCTVKILIFFLFLL